MSSSKTLLISVFFLIVLLAKDSYSQSPKTDILKTRKGTFDCLLGLSGAFAITKNDNLYLIVLRPSATYFLSNSVELSTEYNFSYLKYGSLSPINSEKFSQYRIGLHFYPFKRINFIYIDGGLMGGNYFLTKDMNSIKKWGYSYTLGIGLKTRINKNLTVDFNVRYEIPFNNKYNFDFVRCINIGYRIGKRIKK